MSVFAWEHSENKDIVNLTYYKGYVNYLGLCLEIINCVIVKYLTFTFTGLLNELTF